MGIVNNVSAGNPATPNVNEKKKTSIGKKFLRGTAAITVGSAIGQTSIVPTTLVIDGFEKLQSKLEPNEVKLIKQASDDTLTQMGLKDYGVRIIRLPEKGKKPNFIQKLQMLMNPLRHEDSIRNGLNGCFNPLTNQVIIPENKNVACAFHELGHAYNRNCSKFWKGMQMARSPLMLFAGIPMMVGAFTSQSKPEDGKELTKTQKTKNFIRDNAGKLSFCAMLPVIAEEAMATARGQKYANKLLPKNLAKHVGKSNLLGLGTYVATSMITALATTATVKIRNSMDNKGQKQ